MDYRSLEGMIRDVISEELIQEASLGDSKGLMALARRKTGDEKDVMNRAADMMKKGQIKDLNMFMKAMDKSTHKAIMPFFDKKHHKALHEDLDEAVKMCSEECCGQPVADCKCGPDCEHCNCNEMNEAKTTAAQDRAQFRADKAKLHKILAQTKNISQGIAAIKKALKVSDAEAEQMIMKLINEESEPRQEVTEEDEYKPHMMYKDDKAVMAKVKGDHERLKKMGYTHDNPETKKVEEARGYGEADTHIIMQLRSAQDLGGKKDITFRGGAKAQVDKKHIDKILKLHDHPALKPVQKRQMRVAISKSPKHLASFASKLKEDYDTDNVDSILNESQAERLSSPLKKARLDKEKADRDRDGKLKATAVPRKENVDEAQYKVPSNYASMMQKKKKKDISQQMADKDKKDNISTSDKDKLGKLHNMMSKANEEGFANPAQQAAVMAKLKASGKYKKEEADLDETKGAPKGYHFTRSGQLKKGDANQDGDGGAMLRSDPLDKQRKKIPALPESDDGAPEVRTPRADYKLGKVRMPNGKMVYRKVKKEVDIEK